MKPMLKVAFLRGKKKKKKSHIVSEWHTGYVIRFSQLAAYGASAAYGVELHKTADSLDKNGQTEGS